jgi:predicted dehydrogenase
MFHLKAIDAINNIEVEALSDTLNQRLIETQRVCNPQELYLDYMKLLSNPKVNAVAVNTPPRFHEEIVLNSLNKGKHVLCEKPLSQTVGGCEQIKAKQIETGLVVLPAHNYAFTPSLIKMEQLLERGTIGEPLKAQIFFENNLKTYGPVTNFRVTRHNGLVEDVLPHILSASNPLIGVIKEIEEVDWWCKSYKVCDNLRASLKTERNVSLDIRMSWTRLVPRFRIDLLGTKGIIHSDLMMNPYKVTTEKDGKKIDYNTGGLAWYLDLVRFKHPSFIKLYEHFEKLISNGEEPRISLDDEIGMIKIIENVSEWLEEKPINEKSQSSVISKR